MDPMDRGRELVGKDQAVEAGLVDDHSASLP